MVKTPPAPRPARCAWSRRGRATHRRQPQRFQGGGHGHPRTGAAGPRFQQQGRVAFVRAEPVGKDTACRARADHDKIKFGFCRERRHGTISRKRAMASSWPESIGAPGCVLHRCARAATRSGVSSGSMMISATSASWEAQGGIRGGQPVAQRLRGPASGWTASGSQPRLQPARRRWRWPHRPPLQETPGAPQPHARPQRGLQESRRHRACRPQAGHPHRATRHWQRQSQARAARPRRRAR